MQRKVSKRYEKYFTYLPVHATRITSVTYHFSIPLILTTHTLQSASLCSRAPSSSRSLPSTSTEHAHSSSALRRAHCPTRVEGAPPECGSYSYMHQPLPSLQSDTLSMALCPSGIPAMSASSFEESATFQLVKSKPISTRLSLHSTHSDPPLHTDIYITYKQ